MDPGLSRKLMTGLVFLSNRRKITVEGAAISSQLKMQDMDSYNGT